MTDDLNLDQIAAALGQIPSGLFILTASHEDRRDGMLASWVQQSGFDPPMVSVAVGKGRPILPLISGSHQFGLCQLPQKDKVLLRKFAGGVEPDEDPFLGFELVEPTVTAAPILAGALAYLECEIATHMDVGGDHDLFVGRIIGGAKLGEQKPFVHLRSNGLKY